MRSLAFLIASFALLAGTSAVAAPQIRNVDYTAGSAYITPAFDCTSSSCFRTNPLPEGEGRFPPADAGPTNGGAAYNSFVDIKPNSIFFESSNAVSQGPFSSFSSSSTVSFDFNNRTGGDVEFHSQITPQGAGLYLANTSGGCLFTNSCQQVSDEIWQLSDLRPPGYPETVGGGFLGGFAVSFQIFDNGNEVYSLTGSYLIGYNTSCDGFCILDGLGNTDSGVRSLTGFAQQTLADDFSAIAFGWDATDVFLNLGEGMHAIEYVTSVSTFTNADCLDATTCLIAYAGFGDPIGRGGGIAEALAPVDFGSLRFGSLTHEGLGGLINGLNFTPNELLLEFDGERAVFGVPEPTTWALMILGFGAMGAALRRRRIPAHI